MGSRIRAHLRSNVVGYVALFCFAIGGAASALPGTDTVKSNDIGPGEQVRNRDTKRITSAWVADGSLTAADLADDDSLGTLEVDEALLNVGGDLAGTVADAQIGADAVGAAAIANGSIGTDEIDATQVQRRVGGACAPGSSISAVAADGTVTCEADAGAVNTDLGFHLTETCAANTQKYAVVNSSGTLVRGANAVSAGRLTVGTYAVTFDADVTGCAHNATIGQPGSVGASAPGLVTVAGRSGNAAGVFVQTYEIGSP